MLSRRRLSLVLGFALSVGSPHYAGAQVARWSFDLAVGGASVDGGEYLNNGRAAARLSAANRLLQRGRFGVYAEVGYDWAGTFGLLGANPDLVCIVESESGRCEPPFPDVAGPSASIGLLYAPFTWGRDSGRRRWRGLFRRWHSDRRDGWPARCRARTWGAPRTHTRRSLRGDSSISARSPHGGAAVDWVARAVSGRFPLKSRSRHIDRRRFICARNAQCVASPKLYQRSAP